MRRRAVFLDRDGTVIRDIGFNADPARLEFLPGAPETIRRLNKAGYLVVVVTNQSAVARGLFTAADIDRFHDAMNAELAESGARIDAFYFCPHHPDEGAVAGYVTDCDCRKPKPGMLLQAARDLEIELSLSYMVGDAPRDIEAGLAAGTGVFAVSGGAGTWIAPDVPRVENVAAAVDLILGDSGVRG